MTAPAIDTRDHAARHRDDIAQWLAYLIHKRAFPPGSEIPGPHQLANMLVTTPDVIHHACRRLEQDQVLVQMKTRLCIAAAASRDNAHRARATHPGPLSRIRVHGCDPATVSDMAQRAIAWWKDARPSPGLGRPVGELLTPLCSAAQSLIDDLTADPAAPTPRAHRTIIRTRATARTLQRVQHAPRLWLLACLGQAVEDLLVLRGHNPAALPDRSAEVSA
ncbi:hypothetical protein [Streptomyces sp. NRRL F-5053]|uniref:hypothetical protein n=1 Tax=Streptomyces sp. NRRL F-5053 TaxID=1463854 RepID=UPI0004CAFCD6|nr:hypothetical protein [Streptomyces sp. NRRL F-5053]